MAGLLPQTTDVLQTVLPSKTWKFDPDTGRIGGFIDGLDALQQAIMLQLLIPKYQHLIYSFHFGNELASLIGRDTPYALAAAPALTEECLLQDDRVKAVSDIQVSGSGDQLTVSFTVQSQEGSVSASINV